MFEFFSSVKNGKLQKGVSQEIAGLLNKFEGKKVHIKIEKVGTSRTLRQNNYIHLLIDIFSKELIEFTGDEQYDPRTLKNMLKTKFLLRDVFDSKTGEVVGQKILRTRDLNKEEFGEFTDKVIRYAAQAFNIVLPHPNEQFEIGLED